MHLSEIQAMQEIEEKQQNIQPVKQYNTDYVQHSPSNPESGRRHDNDRYGVLVDKTIGVHSPS